MCQGPNPGRRMAVVYRCSLFAICALLACSQCLADVTLVHDDFDGPALDPAWQVHLDYDPPASSWEYEVTGGHLTVTDVQGDSLDVWCAACVRRECVAPGDFSLECGFSWDTTSEPQTNRAMQQLRVSLVDTAGHVLALVMYYDCWFSSRGVVYALIGSASHQGSDRLPYAGEATVRIERSDETVTVWWNEELLLTETEASAVDSLELAFWYAPRENSFFGPEFVDFVTVTAPETAVEVTTWARIKALFRR
jgi:hypothetical protein